ncbi:DJ-1/PfpI family protein [Streptomyces sp. NPDC101455]|uniref:DJ-1/PfpI family protein n=1 Tax=Streptomyces sp. NPDC101455 TaxID=3366142 RepID=UPI00380FBFCF
MLLYPGLTLLDLVAPHAAFSPTAETHLVWKTTAPVRSDSDVAVHPTTTFADCPSDLDVLFVPGGMHQAATAADEEVLEFLADRGARARYVTSVCGGSLILGAAGLLRGYRATTHWSGIEALALFDAEYAEGRVVVDRNRITGGGVTAGLDFALVVLAELLGDETAKLTQLMLEYAPAPPFDAGTPETAGPELTAMARAGNQSVNDAMNAVAEELSVKGWGRAARL